MDAKVAHFSLTFTILSGLGIVLITRLKRISINFRFLEKRDTVIVLITIFFILPDILLDLD